MRIADFFASLRLKVDQRSFSAAERAMGFVKKALVAVVSAAAAIKFKDMIQEVADFGDHIDELSQKTGVSTEDLTALGYAAGFSGVSIDQLGGALGSFARSADAAARGSKLQAKAFKDIGLDAKKVVSGAIPMSEALGVIADKFADMPDGAKKSALAAKLFRGAGRDLIPFLNEGKDGLAELTKEAEELGVVMDSQTAKEFAEYNDDQDRLKAGWRGIKIEIAKALLPTLKDLTKSFLAWFRANRLIIRQRIGQVFHALGVALQYLGRALVVVGRILNFFINNWKIALAVLASVTLAMMLLGKTSVLSALASAAAWVVATLPIILLGALILAAILVLQDLYSWFNKGDSVIKDWIVPAAHEAIMKVRKEFQEFLDWISGKGQGFNVTGQVGASGAAQRAKEHHRQAYIGTATRGSAGARAVGANATPEKIRKANAVGQGAEDLFNEDLSYGKEAYSLGGTAKTAMVLNQSTGINVYVSRATPEEAQEVARRVKEVVAEEFGTLIRHTADATGAR